MPRWNARLLLSLSIAALMVLVVGCPKKPPPEAPQTTPPPVSEKAAPAEEVKEQGFEQTAETPSTSIEEGGELAKLNAAHPLETVYFDYDKSDLRADALAALKKNVAWIKSNTKYRVRVEGNCDERGTVDYNLALGDRRAATIKSYLVKAGIDASRLETISYGEEHPVDPGHSEEAWAKNRRGDFVIIR